MKKIIITAWLLIGINLYGASNLKCENLFKSAIHNFYLENSCKFDKHISSSIRKQFEALGCTKLFNDDDMKKLNSEVLSNSYKKMNEVGRDNFCKNSEVRYNELAKKYK